MGNKFIRFFSKNHVFNKEGQIQFPADLFPDYKTIDNQLSIFLLDENFLDRICAHFCLMKKGFTKPEKLSYIIFEENSFNKKLNKTGLNIINSPQQIDCGDLGIKHLHYNIDKLTSKNMHNLFLFFNTCNEKKFNHNEIKQKIEKSIDKQYLTFSSNSIKFPKENKGSTVGFDSYIENYFSQIKSPTYK